MVAQGAVQVAAVSQNSPSLLSLNRNDTQGTTNLHAMIPKTHSEQLKFVMLLDVCTQMAVSF